MPPKKASSTKPAAKKPDPKNKNPKGQENSEPTNQNTGATATKRKQSDKQDKPKKEPRVGERRSARGSKSQPPVPGKVASFLLTKEALALARPPEERDAPDSLRTYSSVVPMTPFEELLCAVILSRPISHRLGERTIRTILNGEYNFRTPKALKDAGPEKRLKALWDARTQHKDKTAEQLGVLADIVIEKYAEREDDNSLEKLRKETGEDVDVLAETLSKNIKGVGQTAVNIFMRRIQSRWPGVYPFVDERTSVSLGKLGLPEDPDELRQLIEEHWSESDDETKRSVFVQILERAVGADLEGNSPDKVLEAVQ